MKEMQVYMSKSLKVWSQVWHKVKLYSYHAWTRL